MWARLSTALSFACLFQRAVAIVPSITALSSFRVVAIVSLTTSAASLRRHLFMDRSFVNRSVTQRWTIPLATSNTPSISIACIKNSHLSYLKNRDNIALILAAWMRISECSNFARADNNTYALQTDPSHLNAITHQNIVKDFARSFQGHSSSSESPRLRHTETLEIQTSSKTK